MELREKSTFYQFSEENKWEKQYEKYTYFHVVKEREFINFEIYFKENEKRKEDIARFIKSKIEMYHYWGDVIPDACVKYSIGIGCRYSQEENKYLFFID